VAGREHTVLASVAALAVAALLGAGAVAVAGFTVVRHDRAHIDRLERQVEALCARRVVDGVTLAPDAARVTVHTVKGC